jgi:hypothetical protein
LQSLRLVCQVAELGALAPMNAQQTSSPKRRRWLLHVLAVAPLLMIGADIASIDGSRATTLSLPFATTLYFAPLVAVAACIAGGLLLRARLGSFSWIASFVLAFAITFVPRLAVSRFTQAVPVSRWLTAEEKTAMQAHFPHPYVHYSSSSEGTRLLIRRSDYNASLVEFLRSIHAYPDD